MVAVYVLEISYFRIPNPSQYLPTRHIFLLWDVERDGINFILWWFLSHVTLYTAIEMETYIGNN